MPKRRKKRRGKRREPQQQPPRPNRGGEQLLRPDAVLPTIAQAEQAVASPSLDDNDTGKATDRTVVGNVLEVEREFIWIETEGTRAIIYASELMLDIGEVPADRYAPGDGFEAFAFQMEPDPASGAPQFSIRRAAPYLDALNRLEVGSIIANATVVNTYDLGIELEVDGVRGNALAWELPLGSGETPHARYQPGDTIDDLFVWKVDRNARDLSLSVRRNAPGYVEALNAHSVGEVVSATVTAFQSNGGLWLDVGGVVGAVGPQELSLADGESAQDRYAVGDTVHDLFVWQINHDDRGLSLSVRRNVPGYVEAFNAHSAGDVVFGTVTDFANNGLWLDVGGVIGGVELDELSLADGESAQDRYAVGDPVYDLVVWHVDHDARVLYLSARRNAPGYVEAFNAHSVGDVVSATVTGFWSNGGLWLDVGGVIGYVLPQELPVDSGSAQDRYDIGDIVKARVWQIDQGARDVALSMRHIDSDFSEEPIGLGAPIDAVVRDGRPGGTEVLVASQTIRVPHCELSLGIGERPRFEYRQGIRVVVLALDSDGNPSALSHRRALPEWQGAVNRLVPGAVVPDAQVVPKSAVPENEDRAVVDLGPVNGFVRRGELDAKQAEELMTDAPNTQYPVVVESIEANGVNVIVSRTRFEDRWQELAETISEGDLVDAEFRRVSRDRAIVDLGFGLLAEMPLEQLPTLNDAGDQRATREGDTFKVRITRKEDSERLIKAKIQNQWLVDLIAGDESLTCEFKAVFKGPKPDEPSKNREVYSGLPVLRAMAGLMNRDGGHVLVGITDTAKDKGNVIGWEASGFKSQNDLTTRLSNLVGSKLTPVATVRYEPRFETLPDGREILDIDCEPANRPVFLKDSGSTEFLVRQPAETKPLDAEEQHDYIQERFYGAASDD